MQVSATTTTAAAAARAGQRARARGFTMVELLAYLGIFTSLTATMIGAELSARRINRNEATILDAMYEVDRVFAAVAEDCDRATGVEVPLAPRHELNFTGASKYEYRAGKLLRDGKEISTNVHNVQFIQTDPKDHPRLVRVQVRYVKRLGRDDEFDRTYERTFFIRNLEGARNAGF
ncbi:MAG TPA: hypothetical protein VHF22_03865 [Planctomycetota bacterium]|nr:hypothetical protein [Planctomycetota bacterium]